MLSAVPPATTPVWVVVIGDVIERIARAIARQAIGHVADIDDETRRIFHRVDALGRERRMAGAAAHVDAERALALVADHHVHPGRLADEAAGGLDRHAVETRDQAAHADATDLLVMRERKVDRHGKAAATMSGTAARQHARNPFMSAEPRP